MEAFKPDEPAELLLTVAEVAHRLRTSSSKVYDLIHSGKLRAYRLPAIRVSSQDLQEFLASCRTDARQVESQWRRLQQVKLKHLR